MVDVTLISSSCEYKGLHKTEQLWGSSHCHSFQNNHITTTPKLICSLNYFNLPLTICKFTLFKNQGILDSLCHPVLSGRDPVLGHILFVVCPLGVKITVSQRIIAQIVLVEACWETGQCFARAEKLGLTFTQSLLFTSSESAVSTTARWVIGRAIVIHVLRVI